MTISIENRLLQKLTFLTRPIKYQYKLFFREPHLLLLYWISLVKDLIRILIVIFHRYKILFYFLVLLYYRILSNIQQNNPIFLIIHPILVWLHSLLLLFLAVLLLFFVSKIFSHINIGVIVLFYHFQFHQQLLLFCFLIFFI